MSNKVADVRVYHFPTHVLAAHKVGQFHPIQKYVSASKSAKIVAQLRPDEYMSGVVLLQNIQRIVDENERLKKENSQKSETIDELRERIAQLHAKNEK